MLVIGLIAGAGGVIIGPSTTDLLGFTAMALLAIGEILLILGSLDLLRVLGYTVDAAAVIMILLLGLIGLLLFLVVGRRQPAKPAPASPWTNPAAGSSDSVVVDRCPSCGGLVRRGSMCPRCSTLGHPVANKHAEPGETETVADRRRPARLRIIAAAILVLVLVAVLAVTLTTCGRVSTEDLAKEVQRSIQTQLALEPLWEAMRVTDDLNLVHVESNEYRGTMGVAVGDQTLSLSVDVTFDGGTFLWEIH